MFQLGLPRTEEILAFGQITGLQPVFCCTIPTRDSRGSHALLEIAVPCEMVQQPAEYLCKNNDYLARNYVMPFGFYFKMNADSNRAACPQ
jgi:hypothetical protein